MKDRYCQVQGTRRHLAEKARRRGAGELSLLQVCNDNWSTLSAEMRNRRKGIKYTRLELRLKYLSYDSKEATNKLRTQKHQLVTSTPGKRRQRPNFQKCGDPGSTAAALGTLTTFKPRRQRHLSFFPEEKTNKHVHKESEKHQLDQLYSTLPGSTVVKGNSYPRNRRQFSQWPLPLSVNGDH